MKKEEYEAVSDTYGRLIQTFFFMVARSLFQEHGITLMMAGHIIYLCPDVKGFRTSTFAMGDKDIVLKMPEQLQIDLNEKFAKIDDEILKKDIIKGFQILEKEKKSNRKPWLN